jgi:P-type Mg2+ transporter
MFRFILVLVPSVFPINVMIVTANLAKGAIAMSRKRVIAKRLHAIQNFGAMNVLCTDKTGTLIQDRIILKRHMAIRGEDCDRVLEYATWTAIINRAQRTSRCRGFAARGG